jgi:hypothetical protein
LDETPLDRVRQKRQEQSSTQAEAAKTQSIIEAIKTSGGDTKDSVTSAMHDLLLATLVGKDPKIAEVSKNLAELLTSISRASEQIENSGLDNISRVFEKLMDSLADLPSQIAATDQSRDLIPYLENITTAVKSKNMSPRVEVSPNVTVDLDPLEELFREMKDADGGLDLSKYRPQDLAEDGEAFQYIGFLNPGGAWYIIENDVENNKLRYKFGNSGYAKAWDSRGGFAYKLLDKAINEVQA